MPVRLYGWQIHLPKDLSRSNFVACYKSDILKQMMWSLLEEHNTKT